MRASMSGDNHGDTRIPAPLASLVVRDEGEPTATEDPIVYCPNCSARLLPSRCKLVCPRCGYYLSCADYV